MLTMRSFQNAGFAESEAIGRCFHGLNADSVSQSYLEVLQAEDYVLFRLVAESREQRYGYDQFRKIVEARVHADHVFDVESIIDGRRALEPRTVTLRDKDEGHEIGFRWNREKNALSIAGELGSKFLFIDLDEDDADSLSHFLYALRLDYEEYLASLVTYTFPKRKWLLLCQYLDRDTLNDRIESEVFPRRSDADVSITLSPSEAARIDELVEHEASFSVAQWLDLIPHIEDIDIRERVSREVGLLGDDLPYGTTRSTWLECRLDVVDYEYVRHAAYQAWLNATDLSLWG